MLKKARGRDDNELRAGEGWGRWDRGWWGAGGGVALRARALALVQDPQSPRESSIPAAELTGHLLRAWPHLAAGRAGLLTFGKWSRQPM